MLYFLSFFFRWRDVFNLFRYITFRAECFFYSSNNIFYIQHKFLKKLQKEGQPIRKDGPRTLLKNQVHPQWEVIILLAVTVSTILWARLDNQYVWIILFVTFSFGFIGLIDDYMKVVKRSYSGLSGRLRLLYGFLIAFIAVYFIQVQHLDDLNRALALPIFKDYLVFLGAFFFPFAMTVIVGSANAVNLTDGLDGLAIMPVIIAGASLGIIAYIVGRADYSSYLDVHYIKGSGEILIFSAALIGSGLGFLWYNAPPAAVFMGDTGSLSLGSALGCIAVSIKHELVLLIVGGLFVIETLSVIIQVLFSRLQEDEFS